MWFRREHALVLPRASTRPWKPLGKCSTGFRMPYLCLVLNELVIASVLVHFIYFKVLTQLNIHVI